MVGPNHKAASVLGWYGVAAILTAHALNNFGVWTVQSLGYQILNLTGALAVVVETFYKKDYQPMVLNLVWLAIAVFAVVRVVSGGL